MAVTIKTLDQLTNEILNDYATEFEVDVSDLGDTYIVRAKVLAALQYQIMLALSSVQRNIYYDLAERDQLIRYGIQLLGRTPAPAEAGLYTIQVTGTIGATIPAQTQFKANDSTLAAGYLFILDSAHVLVAETDTIQVRALTVGTGSRLYVDDLLTSTAPIYNVDSEAMVTVVDTEPVAAEDIESYRADVIQSVRLEAQGGSAADYRLWASDVPEVRTVYPYTQPANPGNVDIYVEATKENTAPLAIEGVPTTQTLEDVYTPQVGSTPESGVLITNPVNGNGRKPIGVFALNIYAVNPLPVDIYFTGLSDESIVSQIRSIFDDLLYDIRPFIPGADILIERNDYITIAKLNSEAYQLLAGTGIIYTEMEMEVDGNSETSYQFTFGNYPYLRFIYNNGIVV
jgi:uncharacterized phage protein gp47/JayE